MFITFLSGFRFYKKKFFPLHVRRKYLFVIEVIFLFELPGHLRISDLGLAVEIEYNCSLKGRVGTAGYMGTFVFLQRFSIVI